MGYLLAVLCFIGCLIALKAVKDCAMAEAYRAARNMLILALIDALCFLYLINVLCPI